MSKRRGGRGFARFFWIAVVMIWVIPKVITALGATIAAVVAVPFLLVASVLAIVAILVVLAVAVAVAAGAIALPAWLVWRASRERREQATRVDVPLDDADREASRLRRRYVAGQITDDQYQIAMLANLKARFATGALDVSEYEAEVSRLLRAGVDSTPLRELRRSSRPPEKR